MLSLMQQRGVKKGDRVVVQVDKSIEAVLLYLACLRAGAIYVPLNTAYTPAEVGYLLAYLVVLLGGLSGWRAVPAATGEFARFEIRY